VIDPLLAPVLANSVVAAIPGFAQVAGLVAQSCVDGTVNAFLTLRVGCLASGYCGSVIKPSTSALRRTASIKAAGMLGAVARTGAERIRAAMWAVAKRTSSGSVSVLAGTAQKAFEQVYNMAQRLGNKAGATAATAFLVQLVADGATKTSTTIKDMVFRRWW